MNHLTFERISELAESGEALDGGADARHFSECADCRETLRRMRELLTVAHSLPRDIAPPAEVWTSLRGRIGGSSSGAKRRRSVWNIGGWIAAAAAVMLVAGTAVMVPTSRGKAKGAKPTPVTPPVVRSVDRNYLSTLAELRLTLESQRPSLSASTERVVENSLATIDTAIAEARTALTSDPGNQALVDILSSHYEHKVDLLQRATELAPSF